ncbi:hypothetical protein ASE01_14435 [Nocardioides sp. Root190]|nr:hypothetical protein ASE01_14435 [Nocardioides sp. Root190]
MLLATVVTTALLVAPARAGAAPGCAVTADRPVVVLVHDLAGMPASVAPLARRLEAAGHCTTTVGWGAIPLLAALAPLGPVLSSLPGGLASMETSAAEVGRRIAAVAARTPARRVDVVAVGAGSLVTLRARQLDPHLAVRRLVSVGSLWEGTNLLGLGDLEQLSRDAGTYDLVLGVEKLLMDGVCASCREFIKGSDFLRGLRAAGLTLPGLAQVDIVSTRDGLVVPWTSGRRPGVTTLVVQHRAPSSSVSHFALPRDVDVQDLVLGALR